MRFSLTFFVFLVLALVGLVSFNSCQKELFCPDCDFNRAPVAVAGADRTIILGLDSVILDGSASRDPDGFIAVFLWTKLSGPVGFAIASPDSAKTKLGSLEPGVYSFELTVTDDAGRTAKDTVIVTVSRPGPVNLPPIARAGPDQSITPPENSVRVDASASSDPDGSIVTWAWTQLSGPTQSLIRSGSSIATSVENLVAGNYRFIITVTDNGGALGRDTVAVLVNPPLHPCALNREFVDARIVPVGRLSQARSDMSVATAGNKILFAGGFRNNSFISTRVDIFDFVNNTWSTAELSVARQGMAVTTLGNKVFFAGGLLDFVSGTGIGRVDIYDAGADTWSTAELSIPRGQMAAATLGNKVFFAGGHHWSNGDVFDNRVDIFDNSTNTWSIAALSEARLALAANTAGDKVYFAGGLNSLTTGSNKIDIYDGATNTWTTSKLEEGKWSPGSIVVDNKIYWAGGGSLNLQLPSVQVEIRDINTQASTFECLSQPKLGFATVSKDNDIIFFMGAPSNQPEHFDILNISTNTWSIGRLSKGLFYPSIVTANNKIYVAGGGISPTGQVTDEVGVLEW